ncbi:MAG: NAD-dependent epimerase/dehydratase family protein [Candidatus Lokiarchaeota archaeon]|nr:NAD-dependent epimerase/dehydratase family protein [Candidatus Lokiarchaeota archaeon]
MKILVTGVAGFIGSHLSESLSEMGHEVIGIDNFDSYYPPEFKRLNAEDITVKGVKIYEADLVTDDLSDIVSDAEFVFHLAAQPGISAKTTYNQYIRNNLTATYKLLEAVKNVSDLKCFVNVATSSIYGKFANDDEDVAPKPTSYYGVTKLAAEQLVLAYHREQGLPACSLRIFSVLGPRERPEKLYTKIIRSILMNEPFPLFEGSLNHSRSYTPISDIISGFKLVFKQYEKVIGEIFNIGSDKDITTKDGIAIVEKIMGKKAHFDIKPKRPGDQLHTRANINKARRILGYEPRSSLEEVLRKQISWYKEKIFSQGLQKLTP